MSRKLTASDRKNLIRLASSLPKGSSERRAILAGLKKTWRREIESLIDGVNESLRGSGMTFDLGLRDYNEFEALVKDAMKAGLTLDDIYGFTSSQLGMERAGRESRMKDINKFIDNILTQEDERGRTRSAAGRK